MGELSGTASGVNLAGAQVHLWGDLSRLTSFYGEDIKFVSGGEDHK
jgi:hypothetical protein